jgi:hypothetical protein
MHVRIHARTQPAEDHVFDTGGSRIQNMKLIEICKDFMSTIDRSTDRSADFDRARSAGDPGPVCRNRLAPERVTD